MQKTSPARQASPLADAAQLADLLDQRKTQRLIANHANALRGSVSKRLTTAYVPFID